MSCSFKYLKMFMEMAHTVSKQSHAKRLQVGCVVVKNDRIIGMSYNGTPKGCDNCCEHTHEDGRLTTKDEVIHAEQNAIIQIAKSTESIEGATMFVTHAPCMQCAKMIIQSGLKYVYFDKEYRDDSGLNYMIRNGILVIHLPTLMGEQSPC